MYIQVARAHVESCRCACVEIRLTVDAAILSYTLALPLSHETLLKTHF